LRPAVDRLHRTDHAGCSDREGQHAFHPISPVRRARRAGTSSAITLLRPTIRRHPVQCQDVSPLSVLEVLQSERAITSNAENEGHIVVKLLLVSERFANQW
jgi:hypothetical protein